MSLPTLTKPLNDACVPFYDARWLCVAVDLFLDAATRALHLESELKVRREKMAKDVAFSSFVVFLSSSQFLKSEMTYRIISSGSQLVAIYS